MSARGADGLRNDGELPRGDDCLFLLLWPWRPLWLRGDAEFDWDDNEIAASD